ncbi:MAG: Na+/H+ antiporter NhaA [Actinobacteria bacterium]|nr:Na+/H+ antiporter NhaA [Actinomycetota bacterium]
MPNPYRWDTATEEDLDERPWSLSDRPVPKRVVAPLQHFLHTEVSGGLVLLAAAVIALVWANSPWADAYDTFRHAEFALDAPGIHLELDAVELVNDLLMAVFFFVVGLEIKRGISFGDLSNPRAAAVPMVAAVGGMVVPAAIYLAVNAGSGGVSDGWGIPMATDIAFAVGVLALLGSRVAPGLRSFLLTLAIVDDIGAILVIAVFYTAQLSLGWLAVAAVVIVAIVALRRMDVISLVPYVVLAGVLWYALHESGVHATIAGVILGLLTPARSLHHPQATASVIRKQFEKMRSQPDEIDDQLMLEVSRLSSSGSSPLARLEQALHPWSSFLILPLFALLNAGVALSPERVTAAVTEPIGLGIALGLVVGKPVGVVLMGLLAARITGAALPGSVDWRGLAGVGALAGIGFTVAIFISGLAFTEPSQVATSKVAILGASLVSGVIGYLMLRFSSAADPDEPTDPTRPAPAADAERP